MTMLKVSVSSDDHIQGSKDAAITLVEYGDYECPYCAHAYSIIKQVQEYFGPDLRFVFRNFPLTEVHPFAKPAAQVAEYAASKGLFWDMHDLIYENQPNLSLELLLEIGESLQLSPAKLKEALVSETIEQKIQKDFLGGVRSGVNGTPTLFINDYRYPGEVAFKSLVAAINQTVS